MVGSQRKFFSTMRTEYFYRIEATPILQRWTILKIIRGASVHAVENSILFLRSLLLIIASSFLFFSHIKMTSYIMITI